MPQEVRSNRFLNALSADARARLVAASKPVDLPLGTKFYSPGEEPRYAHFLTAGLVSFVFTSERGNSIELATLGCEAIVGGIFLLGNNQPIGRGEMQMAGAGLRIPLDVLQREFDENVEVRTLVLDFIQQQLNLAYQLVACNRLHRTEARFSRWLLMVQDRTNTDTLHMTQEFLADMLGTRRTTVAEVAGNLQRAGCIEYRRGVIRIVDRDALQSHACECYGLLQKRYQQLYSS